MKYILQVFTGFRHSPCLRAEDIIRKIGNAASGIPVDKVIIGWSMDAPVYRKIGAYLHERGIRMLLWLPVFSEVSEEFDPDPAKDVFGETAGGLNTREGEAFQFVCPTSEHNAQTVIGIYEKDFADCGFDGVFLDRIRSQSFAAGVSGVLSCACGRCRKAFLSGGVDPDDIRKLYEERRDRFFDMVSWPADGAFTMREPLVQRFFEVKEEIIGNAVTSIAGHFKDRGLEVGMDLFAPAVSRFVGQNYRRITRCTDFIKPMLYRRTEAPAGIGYELALVEKHAPEAEGIIHPPMDRAFLHTQLQAIDNLPCAKYPGIEINYDRELVRTDTGYIRESLEAIRSHGFDGATLSWNIMQAPEEHILEVALLESGRA